MTRTHNHDEIERALDALDIGLTGSHEIETSPNSTIALTAIEQSTTTTATEHELRHTETDNSTRFVELHGRHIRYIPKWKKWLIWGGHSWNIDDDTVRVTELGKDVSRDLYRQAGEETDRERAEKIARWATQTSKAGSIGAFVKLARGIDGVAIPHTDLDTDPWLLGVTNGVVDLRTGEHRPGKPDDLMFRQACTAFDANADCPTWKRCMTEWFPDRLTRLYVQRLAGSALVGKQKEHRFVICYGDGANGKGTFVRAVAHVLGDYFITPDKSLIVQERNEKHDTERAALFRTRLAVAVETDKRQRLNEAQIKNLTGGDRIHARRLYENPWEFDPSHSLWLQTNYLPAIQGRDGGIWRRIRVVPWSATFAGTNEDTDLDDKLQQESSGILNWLIAGCLDWQQTGLDEPPQVVNATASYQAAEDLLGRFAADTGLTIIDESLTTASKIRDALTKWCDEEGIRDVPTPNDVANWLQAKGAENLGRRTIDGVRGTWWKNVRFDETSTMPPDPDLSRHTRHTNPVTLYAETPTEESRKRVARVAAD